MTRALLLRRLRFGVWALAAAGLGYLVWRFDTLNLPGGGGRCSPLLAFEPGARLIIDTRPTRFDEGSNLLFHAGESDTLLLGKVAPPPPTASQAVWDAVEGGALWIVTDRLDCPGRDSRELGAIPRSDIRGRIVFSWGP